MAKNFPGNYFEDFRLGQTIRHATPRTVTVGDASLYTALYGTRFAVQSSDAFARADRLSARAGRRPPGVPHRVRQDRAGHLAQCGRQSRLCELPLPRAGVSGRHAVGDVGGDRPQGKLQPQDRHRLCALDRLQRERRAGARLCALGDGAQARRRRAGAGGARAGPAEDGRRRRDRKGLPAVAPGRAGTMRWPAAPSGSAIIRRANASTMWTA